MNIEVWKLVETLCLDYGTLSSVYTNRFFMYCTTLSAFLFSWLHIISPDCNVLLFLFFLFLYSNFYTDPLGSRFMYVDMVSSYETALSQAWVMDSTLQPHGSVIIMLKLMDKPSSKWFVYSWPDVSIILLCNNFKWWDHCHDSPLGQFFLYAELSPSPETNRWVLVK